MMRLRAARQGDRSVLAEVYRTAPFHPGPAHYLAPDSHVPVVITQGVGPGLFPGERLHADVTVDPGAALVVRGQGATKVYPSPPGVHCETTTDLRVGAGGRLWWLPGELLPFANAALESRTAVDLAAGSRFALLEIVTAGRIASGERDAYRRLDLRLRIDRDGVPLLRERAVLDPLSRPAAHGGFDCAALLVLVGYGRPAPPLPGLPAGWAGMDTRDDVTIARAVGPSAHLLRMALMSVLESAGGME
jgi:urease accessory protein